MIVAMHAAHELLPPLSSHLSRVSASSPASTQNDLLTSSSSYTYRLCTPLLLYSLIEGVFASAVMLVEETVEGAMGHLDIMNYMWFDMESDNNL